MRNRGLHPDLFAGHLRVKLEHVVLIASRYVSNRVFWTLAPCQIGLLGGDGEFDCVVEGVAFAEVEEYPFEGPVGLIEAGFEDLTVL
jgi:hypothetical protein